LRWLADRGLRRAEITNHQKRKCPARRPGIRSNPGRRSLRGGRSAAEESEQRRDDEKHDGDEEDDLRNLYGESCDATEPKHCGDECDHQKGQSPTKHGVLLFRVSGNVAAYLSETIEVEKCSECRSCVRQWNLRTTSELWDADSEFRALKDRKG
jgi:hypothetical protein